MSKVRHSKFKNTGVLFELLVRQITNDALNGIDNSPAVNLVKESFKKNTAIKKELNYYQMLMSEKIGSEVKASKFIDIVLAEHKKLNKQTLRREKYNLIKEIKKHYDLDAFFATKISNYRVHASIYNLLEAANAKNTTPLKRILESRDTLLNFITESGPTKKREDLVMERYRGESEDVRLLSYNILLEKFNKKYDSLNKGQKNLLRSYINNISDDAKLKETINKQVTLVAKAIKATSKKVDDEVVRVKLSEVSTQLLNIRKAKKFRDKHLVSVMRAHSLLEEIKNVVA